MAPRSANRLLAALPEEEFRRLAPRLRTQFVASGQVLPHCGRTRVYFPGRGGMCSVRNSPDSLRTIEVAAVGDEGVIGIDLMGGAACSYIQVGDGAVQWLPLPVFQRAMAERRELRKLVDRYSLFLVESVMEAVACIGVHSVEERLCRWLLATHERVGRVHFELTSTLLGEALGIDEGTLGRAMAGLEGADLVAVDAGAITVIDPPGLARMACGCNNGLRMFRDGWPTGDQAGEGREGPARILPLPPGHATCTMCGLSSVVPHKTHHDCLVAIDGETAAATWRVYELREKRAQIVRQQLKMFQNFLKRPS